MALFTDSDLIGLADLAAYEATITKITSTHGINIEVKSALAIAKIGDSLVLKLIRSSAVDPRAPGYWIAGVGALVPPPYDPSKYLQRVVVTTPVQRWLCFEVLSQIFAEAYSLQLNDRFNAKWQEYKTRSSDAEQAVYQLGIGIVNNPLPQPDPPLIGIVAGSAPAGSAVVQVAWVDSGGHEGTLSQLVENDLPDASSFSVAMVEMLGLVPAAAAGWNIYVGWNGTDPTRQNLMPVPVGTSWTLPDAGVLSGPAPVNGQQPDFYVVDPQRRLRG